HEFPSTALALGAISAAHDEWLVRIGHPVARRILNAHRRDDAITVQVHEIILVRATIAVVIERFGVTNSLNERARKEGLGRIRIESRDHIDRCPAQERGYGRVASGAAG